MAQVRRLTQWSRFFAAALVCLPGFAWASDYRGQVTFNEQPMPGVRVTATRDGKSSAVVTDAQGMYDFPDLADGDWTVTIEMTGFTTAKRQVSVAPNLKPDTWPMTLMTLDQIRASTKVVKATSAPVMTTSTVAAPPAAAQKAPAADMANAPAPAAAAQDENAQKANDGVLINGSVNNAATSQYALSQAFGNSRNGRSQYNGFIDLLVDTSALDANQYSLSGIQTPKPEYNNYTFGVNFGGPLRIHNLLPRGPNFFIGYQRVQKSTNATESVLVPTLAQRNGDFSGLVDSQGNPVQLYNPSTGRPFSGNLVPISPQAQALLKFYPLPNVSGNAQYNLQAPLLNSSHQDAFNLRLMKGLNRNQFFGGISLQSTRASTVNIFDFVDKTDSLGLNSNVHWSHRIKARWFLNTAYTFSRSRNKTTPYFENRQNVSGAAGITGNDQDATNWGPPTLSFSSGIAGLTEAQSAFNRNETNAVSVALNWNRSRQTISMGGDFRRQEFNYLAQSNPRGTFGFTGAGTGGNQAAGTGSDFADFLIGIPDTSAIAFGNADKYLRQSVYDAFITDDWRVRPELSVNFGLRWEYGAPITELFGRLVNLDVASGFAAVTPVIAASPTGTLTGQAYPTSLINPDKRGIEPRIGVSWRPISGSSLLVRSGYGIYDDTSVYQATAVQMDQQAPLSKSLSASNSAACPLTLANGFASCATAASETFGIDPNFRVGYAQSWLLSVQRDLPGAFQTTVTYLGIKGTRGVQQFLPNTYPIGGTNPCPSCPSGFLYRTSNGNSTRESGSVQLRRRLRSGFMGNLTYTFSKSIDDDSVLGGQGPQAAGATTQNLSSANTAQDWRNLRGERGLSTFDQRHLLNLQLQYTTGMGIGGHTLLTGWRGLAYKDWTVLTSITAGSGLPQTPIFTAAIPGAACTSCIRASHTGQPIYSAPAGLFLNPAAFTAPAAGAWGNASVGSITGPGQFLMNASLLRTFRLHDRYHLDVRLDSSNALNHVAYSSWVTRINSPQFGAPAGANSMRQTQLTMRLGF